MYHEANSLFRLECLGIKEPLPCDQRIDESKNSDSHSYHACEKTDPKSRISYRHIAL